MAGIVNIVRYACCEVELHRSVLIIDQAKEVALDAAHDIGPDPTRLGKIDIPCDSRWQFVATVIPVCFHAPAFGEPLK
ncbi:hypothetical protein GCM10016234_17820 [Tianweitania populi]|uniref:Uncharacterized protein n=1 Tax=Tianweitania populi TaxID=1607949 RepID=A0A8J3GKP5_9HYPH|nr:hypothetical protein GCM10016234_17820 [Tianweitania populi]